MLRFLSFGLLLCLSFGSSWASPPEKVLPLTRAMYSLDYYLDQAEQWQLILEEEPSQTTAWLNYYTAARNANILGAKPSFDLDQIVTQTQEHIPETFEGYYIQYWNGSLAERNYEALLMAHQLAPERPEVFCHLLHYYEIRGQHALFQDYARRLYRSNTISPGILNWNYNALESVAPNGILLTLGDNDTYPAWVLQQVQSLRTDVRVLNVYLLLAYDDYRDRIFRELAIPIDFNKGLKAPIEKQLQVLVDHMLRYTARPLHLGIAIPNALRSQSADYLYLTGLAFRHTTNDLDNIQLLQRNYEEKFRLDDLVQPLGHDPSISVVNHMNINYIPSILLVHRAYEEAGQQQQADQMAHLAQALAERGGRPELVRDYFAPPNPPFESLIDIRTIEKKMEPAGTPGLYASATEVTNAEYEQFLQDLLRQRAFDLMETCKISPTDWKSLLPEEYQGFTDHQLFENGHPESEDAPIVQISHEAAQAYCDWLSQVYNQSTHRKKQFTQVRFRLPSAEEWEIAARGGRVGAPYAWGGPYYQNAKGCYLANFNPYLDKEEQKRHSVSSSDRDYCPESPAEDGAFFPVRTDAYHPNDYGLFNVCGNVAEMIDAKGLTKGGGWMDASYYMQIGVQHEQAAPSPNVGFRVFMEVVKE